jgi:hypothetical protein
MSEHLFQDIDVIITLAYDKCLLETLKLNLRRQEAKLRVLRACPTYEVHAVLAGGVSRDLEHGV